MNKTQANWGKIWSYNKTNGTIKMNNHDNYHGTWKWSHDIDLNPPNQIKLNIH